MRSGPLCAGHCATSDNSCPEELTEQHKACDKGLKLISDRHHQTAFGREDLPSPAELGRIKTDDLQVTGCNRAGQSLLDKKLDKHNSALADPKLHEFDMTASAIHKTAGRGRDGATIAT